MNSKLKYTGGGLLAALLALFGYHVATTPSTPSTPTKPDTAIHAPPVVQDTVKTPPPVVQDTPRTPVPPPSTSGTSLSGKQLLGDDYTNYATTADFLKRVTKNVAGGTGTTNLLYTDGVNASLAELDKTILYNGHPTLRYNQPAGGGTPELWAVLPKPLTHLWFRAHIRFSPGWTTTGTSGSGVANAYKLLGWGHVGYDGSGRLEITNTTQYDFYWVMTSRAGATVGGGGHTSGGNIATEWSDGAWYTYVIEVDYSKSPAVTRFYLGRSSATPTLRATTPGNLPNGSPVQLNYVLMGLNKNQAGAKAQSLNYGDWEVVSGIDYSDPFGVK